MKKYFFSKKNMLMALLLISGIGFVSYSPVAKRETKPVAEKGLILKGAEKSGYTEVNTRSL